MDASLTNKAERLAREIATQATALDDLNGLMWAIGTEGCRIRAHSPLPVL